MARRFFLMIHTLLTLLATGLYLTAGAGLTVRLLRQPDGLAMRAGSLAAAAAAAAAHGVVVWQSTWTPVGLNLGFFHAASLIGWVMAAFLLVSLLRRPVENLGVVILPLAGVAALASLLFGRYDTSVPVPAGVDLHILFSLVAYSLLAIAAVQALGLAVQEHQLRHRRPGGIVRMLPPLQTMEHLLFQMLYAGFALLTLGLASGWLFTEDLFAQHLVHKTVLSIVAWLVFGVLLWGRQRFGWRGQTAIRWTLAGFASLALAYFGSKLVLELILGR